MIRINDAVSGWLWMMSCQDPERCWIARLALRVAEPAARMKTRKAQKKGNRP